MQRVLNPYRVDVTHRSLKVIMGKDLEDLLQFVEPFKLLDWVRLPYFCVWLTSVKSQNCVHLLWLAFARNELMYVAFLPRPLAHITWSTQFTYCDCYWFCIHWIKFSILTWKCCFWTHERQYRSSVARVVTSVSCSVWRCCVLYCSSSKWLFRWNFKRS